MLASGYGSRQTLRFPLHGTVSVTGCRYVSHVPDDGPREEVTPWHFPSQ